jgi:hypothetical protein
MVHLGAVTDLDSHLGNLHTRARWVRERRNDSVAACALHVQVQRSNLVVITDLDLGVWRNRTNNEYAIMSRATRLRPQQRPTCVAVQQQRHK